MKPIPMDGVIFDLDGTLVDSCQDIADSLNYTLKTLGLPEKSADEVKRFVGDGVRVLLTRATGREDDDFLNRASEIFRPYYYEHCVDKTALYPGVAETLDRLKSRKKLGLVSNKPHDMVLKCLRKLGLHDHFDSILGAESTPRRKPHPEPVLKSIADLCLAPQTAIMVGDGTADMQAGKGAGVYTCAVTYGYRGRDELQALRPDFMIDRIQDLPPLISAETH